MIRNAKIDDDEILTRISFKSKGYWGYPKEYFNIWTNELTISSEYIRINDVFVYENDGVIIGYYSIIELKDDIESLTKRSRLTGPKAMLFENNPAPQLGAQNLQPLEDMVIHKMDFLIYR